MAEWVMTHEQVVNTSTRKIQGWKHRKHNQSLSLPLSLLPTNTCFPLPLSHIPPPSFLSLPLSLSTNMDLKNKYHRTKVILKTQRNNVFLTHYLLLYSKYNWSRSQALIHLFKQKVIQYLVCARHFQKAVFLNPWYALESPGGSEKN